MCIYGLLLKKSYGKQPRKISIFDSAYNVQMWLLHKPDFAGRLKKSPKCGTNLEIQKERIWTDMNKLKCSVTTCRHNANDLCELRKIQVDGPAALESRETRCGSYAERTSSSETSWWMLVHRAPQLMCIAAPSTARITITASAARTARPGCCADPEVVSETECCTFERRA